MPSDRRPMRNLLLIRGSVEYPDAVELELVSGTTVRMPKFGWNAAVIAELHRNLLKVAAHKLPSATAAPNWLAKALDAKAAIAVVDDDGRLLVDGNPVSLAYDETRGLTKWTSAKNSFRLDENHSAYTDYQTEEYPYESCDW